MKHWKKITAVLATLLIIFFVYKRAIATPVGVTSVTVTRKTLSSGFTANGKVLSHSSIDLKFISPAKVSWIKVRTGDQVRAWQAVAGLDTVSLNAAYQTALNNYKSAVAAVEETYDAVKGHSNDESFAIRARRTAAESLRDNAYNAVTAAKDALTQSTLISPISGTVVDDGGIIPGMLLSAADLSTKSIRIADMDKLYFEAEVDEIDYSKIREGQEAVISVDAFPGQSCAGKVTKISRSGRETAGGVISFPVEVSLQNCTLNLALNLNGEARFVENKSENVLTIPKKYLVTKNGENFVNVQSGDTTRSRKLIKVDTGISSLDEIEIKSGLNEGDIVLYLP